MKWKFMAKTVAYMSALLGIAELPVNGATNALDLDAAQRQKIVDALGEEMAKKAIEGIDSEIKQMTESNMELKAIQDEIDALVKESSLTEEEIKNIAKDEKGDSDMLSTLQTLKEKQKEQAAIIQKLVNEPEGDVPSAIINVTGRPMQHSKSHLFNSGKSYDAFDGGRSWNTRMATGSHTTTDFNKTGVIPLLQNDMEHFVEENNGVLSSWFNDFRGLPSQWDTRTGVLDRVSDGYILPDEIVQARAKGWSPKNNFLIGVEAGQIFRKKIDITFSGYELQEIENTWIRSYNKEGSHPWKMSFIGFLLGELIKRQSLDDRIAQINGIYVNNGGGDDNPGLAIHSQNGLRYLWNKHKVDGKYRPFDMGAPTEANIVDYIDDMISRIPEIERNEQGMEIQLSSRWLIAYRKRAGELYPKQYSTDQGKMKYSLESPIDYPNFIFQELIDSTKTDFIGITKSKNIQILEYIPSEKGKFTVTHEKRDTHIFADYRLGIRIIHAGIVLEEGDSRAFEMQKIWSNNMPVFGTEVFVPTFDLDKSGIVKTTFNNIQVADNYTTDITSIKGATPGTLLRVKGNTKLVAAKNLKNNSNNLLVSDFPLNTGGTITLYVQADGKLKELSRTAAAEPETTDKSFDAVVLDVTGGTVFRFAGAATKALTNIINGVEGKTIKIYGNDTATVNFTLSTTGNVSVASAATLAKSTDFVQLTNVGGNWVETDRSIT